MRLSDKIFSGFLVGWLFAGCLVVSGCAQVSVPDARNLDVPTPKYADERKKAVNERPDSVMYLPLGEDVLVPEAETSGFLSFDEVGPFEIRSETLAGALQLILADYDISLAFETEEALTRRVTVANLRGPLHTVVNRVCSLANLYCSYEEGILVVKDTQTFTVTVPPIGVDADDTEFLDNVVEGLTGVLGEDADDPISDATTRTIVYTATQRTADLASRYFQRLRAATALVVFETYIWEVQLNAGNSTGIDWDQIDTFGKFNASIAIDGAIDSDFTNPVSIGLPTTQNIGAVPTDLVQFLSQFGAVKSISQPQITVLSGSTADLRVADTNNYVSEISTTIDEGQATTSVTTDSVDSGFELTIGSSWDKSTVYANIALILTNVIDIANFTFSDSGDDSGTDTTIQLPQTSERELNTNIRVRPGDSILIAGLVTEDDSYSSRGPGTMKPILPDSRTSNVNNLELVILLRPRVVVYTPEDDYRYQDYVQGKHNNHNKMAPFMKSGADSYDTSSYSNTYEQVAPAAAPIAPVAPVADDPFLPVPQTAPVETGGTTSFEPALLDLEDELSSSAPSQPVMAVPQMQQPAPQPYVPAYTPPVAAPPSQPTYTNTYTNTDEEPSAYQRPTSISRSGGYVSRVSRQPAYAAPSYSSSYDSAPAPAPAPDSLEPVMEYAPAAPATSSAVEIVPIDPAPVDNSAYTSQDYNHVPAADLQASPYESYDYYVPSY